MKIKFQFIRPFVALICFGAAVAMTAGAIAGSRNAPAPAATLAAVSSPSAPGLPNAATPPSGTLDPANPTITYTDGPTAPNPTGILGAPDCTVPNSCSDFAVTVNASSLAATHNMTWVVQWTPPNVDLDIFVEDAAGNLVANNNSTTDPSAIILPIPANGTVYHLVVAASVGTAPINGSVSLTTKFPAAQQGAGAPPRYINYPAGPRTRTLPAWSISAVKLEKISAVWHSLRGTRSSGAVILTTAHHPLQMCGRTPGLRLSRA
jgi:hypothetical protein